MYISLLICRSVILITMKRLTLDCLILDTKSTYNYMKNEYEK